MKIDLNPDSKSNKIKMVKLNNHSMGQIVSYGSIAASNTPVAVHTINNLWTPSSAYHTISPTGSWTIGPAIFASELTGNVQYKEQKVKIYDVEEQTLIDYKPVEHELTVLGKNIKDLIKDLLQGKQNALTLLTEPSEFWREMAKQIYKEIEEEKESE